MKIRSLGAAGVVLALTLGMSACGESEDTDPTTIAAEADTTEPEPTDAVDGTDDQSDDSEEPGVLQQDSGFVDYDTDLEADILEGSGVAITVDSSTQTVLFELLDPDTGESYENTFEFDYAAGEYRHHKYVSAMGATFDYTMDMETNEIQSIIDSSGEEGIDAVIKQGRLEIAQADRDNEREELETYFEERYGMTVEEGTAGLLTPSE